MSRGSLMKQFLIQAAKKGFYGTLLSRISGMFRDITLAFFFGGSPHLAAFFVAYRFANLFRRLLGEGFIQAGFIPYFEKVRAQGKKEEILFFRDLFFSLMVVLGGGIGLVELVGLWGASSEIGNLSKVMLPGLFFLSMHALNTCLLNVQGYFFSPSVSTVFFNSMWILFAALSYYWFQSSVFVLAVGVVVGFFLQWLFSQLATIKLISLDRKTFFQPQLFSPQVKALFPPLSMGLLSMSASQVNSALDGIFARLIESRAPLYLWYAIRLQQLPLALFTLVITSVLLPQLSKALVQKKEELFLELLTFAGKITTLFAVFCSFFLWSCGGEVVNFLFGKGAFLSSDVYQTVLCLWGYIAGLLSMTLILVLNTVYYAQKEYKIPYWISILSVGVNIGLNVGCMGLGTKAASLIAWTTSFAALLQSSLLWLKLPRKPKAFAPFLWKSLGAGMGALLVVYLGQKQLGYEGFSLLNFWKSPESVFPRDFWVQLKRLGIGASLFTGSFFLLCYLFQIQGVSWSDFRRPPPFTEKA